MGENVDGVATENQENLAAWLYGKDDLRIEPYVPLPENLGPHDVRVQMKAVGICGSDVHYLKHLCCGPFVVREPMVIGHESAGVVLEVGSGVTNLSPGDGVALEPGLVCGKCRPCATGRYNLCPDIAFFATPPVHGSLANEIVYPSERCFKIPEGLTLEEGAMCEPLSVGVHACRRAGIRPGDKVAVLGAGPIGLVVLMVAKVFGASKVVVADLQESRLAMAAKLGATATLCVSKRAEKEEKEKVQKDNPLDPDPYAVAIAMTLVEEEREHEEEKEKQQEEKQQQEKEDDMVSGLRSLLDGDADVVIDCVGMERTMTAAIAITRPAGRVCMVGLAQAEMKLPIASACVREVDIVGVFRYCHTYPLCLDLMASKRVDVKPLITHRFRFTKEDLVEAFETSARGDDAIKVMFNL
ncbi:hypothetical protein CBR_g29945 [Chara braunii]|uniref:Enoyl reductase (ER) domain-containing protein n=1 Tax=Chara braunii TaxID=69332 RepID=A0A388LBI7_CHABU|nr:hypothetical protein CBR_g29945 [Chara braunii]|eukprot:GBG79680.1 hypothetical protein CBR_g29945 [Chara braunii]